MQSVFWFSVSTILRQVPGIFLCTDKWSSCFGSVLTQLVGSQFPVTSLTFILSRIFLSPPSARLLPSCSSFSSSFLLCPSQPHNQMPISFSCVTSRSVLFPSSLTQPSKEQTSGSSPSILISYNVLVIPST